MKILFLFLFLPIFSFANPGGPAIREAVDILSNPGSLEELMCAGDSTMPVSQLLASNACQPKFQCDFYQNCMNKILACNTGGVTDYFTNYGGKYCKKFKENLYHNPRVTTATKLWTRCTMLCLQKSLINEYTRTDFIGNAPEGERHADKCQRYHTKAFNSHPDCYTNSGLCFLAPPSQQLRIAAIVDSSDLLSRESGRQVLGALANCGLDYLDSAAVGAPRRRTREQQAVLEVQILTGRIQLCNSAERLGRRVMNRGRRTSNAVEAACRARPAALRALQEFDQMCQ